MKFCPGNDEKILEATEDEFSAPRRGRKCAKMETDVKFENTSDYYVKFRPEIEKKLWKSSGGNPRWGYSPSEGDERLDKIKTDIKYENTSDSYVKFCPGIEETDKKFWRPPKMRLVSSKGAENVPTWRLTSNLNTQVILMRNFALESKIMMKKLEGPPTMRLVPLKRGQKYDEMKTNVKSENTSDSCVKFRPRIEKNDKKIREATKIIMKIYLSISLRFISRSKK